jgi:putative toxin-antitoxin system antitoxin component (TIGR02293 family)
MNIHAAINIPLDYERIEKGVSAASVWALVKKGEIAREDVYRVIPERTFKRRLAARGKLRLDEADAIARMLRVAATARWAFDNEADAKTFLDQPNPALGNRVPRVMAASDAGAREVEALLYRFVFGDYA